MSVPEKSASVGKLGGPPANARCRTVPPMPLSPFDLWLIAYGSWRRHVNCGSPPQPWLRSGQLPNLASGDDTLKVSVAVYHREEACATPQAEGPERHALLVNRPVCAVPRIPCALYRSGRRCCHADNTDGTCPLIDRASLAELCMALEPACQP